MKKLIFLLMFFISVGNFTLQAQATYVPPPNHLVNANVPMRSAAPAGNGLILLLAISGGFIFFKYRIKQMAKE